MYRYWQDYSGIYFVYQGVPIDCLAHVPVPVAQYSAKSEYNSILTEGIDLEHFRMINNDLKNKDPDVVPEQALIIILNKKSDVCMVKNGNGTKHTKHISIINELFNKW